MKKQMKIYSDNRTEKRKPKTILMGKRGEKW